MDLQFMNLTGSGNTAGAVYVAVEFAVVLVF